MLACGVRSEEPLGRVPARRSWCSCTSSTSGLHACAYYDYGPQQQCAIRDHTPHLSFRNRAAPPRHSVCARELAPHVCHVAHTGAASSRAASHSITSRVAQAAAGGGGYGGGRLVVVPTAPHETARAPLSGVCGMAHACSPAPQPPRARCARRCASGALRWRAASRCHCSDSICEHTLCVCGVSARSRRYCKC